MPDRAGSSIIIDAGPAEVMAVIADFAAYPQWATGITSAEVMEPGSDGRAVSVRMVIDAGPVDDEQVLTYHWDGDRSVNWILTRSRQLRSLRGSYTVNPTDTGTSLVTHKVRLDPKVPVIGVLKRRAEQLVTERALTCLKHRVEDLAYRGRANG